MTGGELKVLAIFDKPDPLEGPFFEETIYVTPSRESGEIQTAIIDTARQAVRALGLYHGPVHAEMRVNARRRLSCWKSPRVRSAACARGHCVSTGGMTLEEVVILHAVGRMRREKMTNGFTLSPPAIGRHDDSGSTRGRLRIGQRELKTLCAQTALTML